MEASRILSVLKDAVSQLQLAAVFTSNEMVMDRLEVMEDAIGKEVLLCLYELRTAVDDMESSEGSGVDILDGSRYANRAIMALKADPETCASLDGLNALVSPAYAQLITELARLVSFGLEHRPQPGVRVAANRCWPYGDTPPGPMSAG